MGTIVCSRILNRAAKTLLDETGVHWAAPELLDYLNAGINAVVAAKPDAGAVIESFELAISQTKQTIPASGFQFLDCTRNMGPGGETAGAAIRQIERRHLDHADPNWHTTIGTSVVHYAHDPRTPRVFWVYPAVNETAYVEITYAKSPAAVNAGSTLPIDDLYENPLHNWVIAHAYAKNSKRGDLTKTNAYLTLFNNALGIKAKAQEVVQPRSEEAEAA